MRLSLLPVLAVSLLVLGGCLTNEFTNFASEWGEQGSLLADAVQLDLAYFKGVNTNTTRTDRSMQEIARELDEIWARRVAAARPAAPVVLEGAPAAPAASFVYPIRTAVVAPPDSRVVEKVADSDVVIIRERDGRVTLTNRPGEANP
ncbi:MAG: hypothetical protein JXQ29_08090 [Planctomycetes bacterium]|nr:hypothetical protein [Planctomycetota bacterium]